MEYCGEVWSLSAPQMILKFQMFLSYHDCEIRVRIIMCHPDGSKLCHGHSDCDVVDLCVDIYHGVLAMDIVMTPGRALIKNT